MTDLDRDILIAAMTVWQEARGEGPDGIRAVAHAIMNRHEAGKWYSRKTIAGTCLLAYAFSGWMTTDSNHEASAEVPMVDPIMTLCVDEVSNAVGGLTKDPTGGATHYFAAGTPEPLWVSGRNANGAQVTEPATYLTRIGKHLFYKNVA